MSHQEPITVARFAAKLGVSERCILRWCRDGKIIGARKHPLTKRWTIYPPAKLAMGTDRWRFPALKGGAA
jgi:hypothetical protein